jgi:predicted lysophospholipase L1 biosynthesis ABC-type transport system permease subunit
MAPTPDPDRRTTAAERAQRDEMASALPAHSSAVMTKGQAKFGFVGIVGGAIAGALVGILIALAPVFDMEMTTRMAVLGLVGAMTGAVIGVIVGGGFGPDAEGETGSQPGDGPRTLAQRRSGHAS